MIIAFLTYKCRFNGKIVEYGVIFNGGESTFHRFDHKSLHLVKEQGGYPLHEYTIDCVIAAAKRFGIGKNLVSLWMPDRYGLEIQYGLSIECHFARKWQLIKKSVSGAFISRHRIRERLSEFQ
jgi:hypothetical protein